MYIIAIKKNLGVIIGVRVIYRLDGSPFLDRKMTEVALEIREMGYVFHTAIACASGYKKGQKVHDLQTKFGIYLRSDGNEMDLDNLENLPLF